MWKMSEVHATELLCLESRLFKSSYDSISILNYLLKEIFYYVYINGLCGTLFLV